MIKRLLLCLAALYSFPAWADELPQKVILSGPLVEEIVRVLVSRPYSETAMTIAKLQMEVQHQVAAPQPSPAPDKPVPPKVAPAAPEPIPPEPE
jgi:hypothetical protein